MYGKGQGVPQDYAEAVRWFRRAAEQEHPDAQYYLGLMYDKGRGVPQDYAEAVRWYRRAAEQEHPGAQNNLSLMYDKGRGVPLNHGKLGQTKMLLCNMPEVPLYRDYAQNEDLGDMMAVVCRFRIDKKDKVLRVCKGTILSASRGTRKVYVVSYQDVEGDELFTYSD